MGGTAKTQGRGDAGHGDASVAEESGVPAQCACLKHAPTHTLPLTASVQCTRAASSVYYAEDAGWS